MSDIPTVSNVRQDLTKWQETHAKFVLLTVKVRVLFLPDHCVFCPKLLVKLIVMSYFAWTMPKGYLYFSNNVAAYNFLTLFL